MVLTTSSSTSVISVTVESIVTGGTIGSIRSGFTQPGYTFIKLRTRVTIITEVGIVGILTPTSCGVTTVIRAHIVIVTVKCCTRLACAALTDVIFSAGIAIITGIGVVGVLTP